MVGFGLTFNGHRYVFFAYVHELLGVAGKCALIHQAYAALPPYSCCRSNRGGSPSGQYRWCQWLDPSDIQPALQQPKLLLQWHRSRIIIMSRMCFSRVVPYFSFSSFWRLRIYATTWGDFAGSVKWFAIRAALPLV
jgi:hypothetical protein